LSGEDGKGRRLGAQGFPTTDKPSHPGGFFDDLPALADRSTTQHELRV